MTNREAIHILRGLKKYYKDYFDSIDNEAIDMAIMRLMEQEQDSVDYIRKEVRDKNMPNSLKCKIKHLRHNGTLTERECDRILKALKQEDVLEKIRAEIESQRKEVSKKHSEHEGLSNYYFGLNDGLKDARDIIDEYKVKRIDKYKAESEEV